MEQTQGTGKKRYKRRQYIVDKKFQYKYILTIVGVGVLLSLIFSVMIYQKTIENTELFEMCAKTEIFSSAFESLDQKMILYLAVFIAGMAITLGIWSIFITHRIVGPIYIINRYINSITDGILPAPRPLRKKDEFKNFFADFNNMVNKLKDMEESDLDTLKKIKEFLEKQGADSQIIQEVQNKIDEKERFLGLVEV